MRFFGTEQLLWSLAFSSTVLGFPDAGGFHVGRGHKDLHKRCPYADAAAAENPHVKHDKRFLFSTMNTPVDSM